MFEAEIESTKLRLVELLLPRASASGLHLSTVIDHPHVDRAYKEFFRAEVEWLLYHDRMQRKANLPIDPADPLFRHIWDQFEQYVRTHAYFERMHALGVIDTAVKSVLNYRIRPRVTLKWFVYRGEPTKPVCEIALRMKYFADYPYFRSGFEQWMHERSLDSDSAHIMPVFEFERLVKQLDDDYILDLSTTEFIDLLDPLFAFFNDLTTPKAAQALPIEALIVFLDDKGIQIIAQKFERMLYHDGVRAVTREMVLRVVDQVLQELEQAEQHAQPEHSLPPSDESSARPQEAAPSASVAGTVQVEYALEDTAVAQSPDETSSVEADLREQTASGIMPEFASLSPEEQIAPPLEQEKVTAPGSSIPGHQAMVSSEESQQANTTIPSQSPAHIEEPVSFDVSSSGKEAQSASLTSQTEEITSTVEDYGRAGLTGEDTAGENRDLPPQTAETPVQASREKDTQGDVGNGVDSEEADAETIALLRAMLEEQHNVSGHFHTSSADIQSALEREFALAPVASPNNSQEPAGGGVLAPPESAPLQEQEAHTIKSEVAASPEKELSLPTGYDTLLESGLHRVRVKAEVQSRSLCSLSLVLDENTKEVMLKKLCDRDRFRFEGLLARLDAAPTMRAALNELDRYCAEYGIDPSNKAVQELRLVLVKRYTLA
ncbi:MAG: hypothetical protein RMK00_03770 [Bacteroidota bacterium]|nr:hypothetical protein [Candidatus Kapabacteria bacterium]MCX7937329.1 hypothetical protein [Chlorobiota bacterium]MDW8074874.1 hypothetical protein [Bacteroidota bacterium]